MNKIYLLIFMLGSSGCQTLANPQGAMQPVKTVDAKQKIYFTTCSGAVENWYDCYNKAKKTCKNKYEVMSKVENPVGGRRELTFSCTE